jgi:maltose phosphorylase
MNQDYIVPNNWSIIEEGFEADRVKSSESLFSIGNGAMGQRANFEEHYSGDTFQGSYIAGVYYPDKTKVGWWKNGYPEYFAKVLNAPNWIGINIEVNGENLDLATCKSVSNFRRELNMQEGWYQRSFQAILQNDVAISVDVTRFLSLDIDELGAIKYQVTPINTDAKVVFKPYLDAGIENEDTNWEEKFWETLEIKNEENSAFIVARTLKTKFTVATYMQNQIIVNNEITDAKPVEVTKEASKIMFSYEVAATQDKQ